MSMCPEVLTSETHTKKIHLSLRRTENGTLVDISERIGVCMLLLISTSLSDLLVDGTQFEVNYKLHRK